ncbi:Rieske 2Fe-2S domain-containing protein [Altericista sp. CCNU0014]|uniref:aromatic ring-hydroxylating dioxygenase subunit alpha n=1 Tax=Altericista sp. CCNU0014 TaxID=3082949 RepID=UPI00384EC6CD
MTAEAIDRESEIIAPSVEEETFQWTKQWYPVAVIEFLDPAQPHGLQLLGKEIAIWRDGTGKWQCFEDACPHRLAPLSEGRVEKDGTLLCAYHAWRFDGRGNCKHIPQSKDNATEAKNCTNPKANAIAFPTQERQGLLWVWAESGERARAESQSRSPRLIPELEENASPSAVKKFWNIRDLPYGWDFFIENVSDPAHVPVSHHGLVGNRYKDAQYYDMPRLRDVSTQEGFAFGVTSVEPSIVQTKHDFQPPCLMKITTIFKDEGQLILVLYATPTRPGWCRHIGCQVMVKNSSGELPKGLAFFALPMPTWLGHVLASLFLHQDLVFLHYQEKAFAKKGGDRWSDSVFTPNPQDKMVITFRQWLHTRAGGGVPWDEGCNPSLPAPERDKARLFDVWNTHTKECSYCQNALRTVRRIEFLAYGIAIFCFGIGIFFDARSVAAKALILDPAIRAIALQSAIPSGALLGAMLGSALFGTVGYALKKFGRLFYAYEFNHAKND